ncbi:mRNA-capping enzyme subunit beta [Plectosphaerella plurivora]|uniref:mRNA-capping enzyme subunit beta n=1 Tax=Plectosphaerella plurivora TaxID=936078 RepID=A0A9P8V224_9PEZI|nr:mRNA-capping enzyme subunit beta [Plectosphaerella plurivora]
MDLRSLVNPSDDGDRPSEKPAPQAPPHAQAHAYAQQQQQHHQQHHQQPPQTPTTPAQSNTSYAFRESAYSHALHTSPGKPPAPQEYAVHAQPAPGAYPPPQSPYQTPGPYHGRPSQPSLQTQYGNDPRSPGGQPAPGPSPYRQVPTPSTAGPGSGYPFPPSGQGPPPGHEATASPVQRHQYPPTSSYSARDSYSHATSTPLSATGPPSHPGGPYAAHQQHHPVPQTPPVGAQANNQAYIHQRSQSTHSTPTPTSAQSQHQYGQPYPRGSPVVASHPPPVDYNRQPSQPPTPLGPPLSTSQRQSSAAPNSFAHPSSPYQQRMSVALPQGHQPHATPPPPHQPNLHRTSSSHTAYDSRALDAHRRSQSHSERDKSLSPSMANILEAEPHRERAATPAKRKLADRDLSPRELEKTDVRPPPKQVNGSHASLSRASTQPAQPKPAPAPPAVKKRTRHPSVPVWAQMWNQRENRRLHKANFELQKRGPPGVNGSTPAKVDRSSRHPSPEATRTSIAKERPAEPVALKGPEDLLGPWEPCIIGVKPYEEIPKMVADFIFIHVVSNPDNGEIMSRNVQFEIEAKLGTLIDKDTNERVDKYVSTECLLQDTGRLAFKSSMTTVCVQCSDYKGQHKGLNDWLNDKVVNTNPQNPDPKVRGRVQIQYKHRRELDKFYELPSNLQGRLPGCVRSRFQAKHSVKVRVTTDQKTGQVLGKIVKARVADLNLHLPSCPHDCRISINLEAAWDGSVEELEQLAIGHESKFTDRSKDRLSYTQSHYQIDLTQVTQQVPGPNNTMQINKEHELEVELNPTTAIDQGRRAMSGQPHRYAELIEGFVDNIRILARTSGDFV